MSSLYNASELKWTKTCMVIGGCIAAGASAYIVYRYYKNKTRMIDEGFEDISVADDSVKKILVLGLDGAGKSTFLSQLAKTDDNIVKPDNTKGFCVVSVHCRKGKTLNFSEIGGSESIRVYWPNFVLDTDLLVYIVDSSDEHRLAESVKELRILTATDKLKKVPIIILANKQDLKGAASPESIAAAFDIPELSKQNHIVVLPVCMPPGVDEVNQSVIYVKELTINLCFGTRK